MSDNMTQHQQLIARIRSRLCDLDAKGQPIAGTEGGDYAKKIAAMLEQRFEWVDCPLATLLTACQLLSALDDELGNERAWLNLTLAAEIYSLFPDLQFGPLEPAATIWLKWMLAARENGFPHEERLLKQELQLIQEVCDNPD